MKHIFLVLFLNLLVHANDYLFVDLSRGLSPAEFKEIGLLSMPAKNTQKDIYTVGDKVFLYAFTDRNALNRTFEYKEYDKDELGWKDAHKKHLDFFKKIKPATHMKKSAINSNVIFLVDTSGSMIKNNLIEDVKSTMDYLVDNKSQKAKISIVTFDGKKGMKEGQKAKVLLQSESDKNRLHEAIANIHASKYDTFLGAGLQLAHNILLKAKKDKTLVMIFTDGKEINDEKYALQMIEKYKNENIAVKVVAVGGADTQLLTKFSTSGYVYNATVNDLQSIIKQVSLNDDAIFLRLNAFLSNSLHLSKNDRLFIYSSMVNTDNDSDFNIVPNIASKNFYDEMMRQNAQKHLGYEFNGAKVYVRLLGEKSADDVNKLRIFWEEFFKDHHANVSFFGNTNLSKSSL